MLLNPGSVEDSGGFTMAFQHDASSENRTLSRLLDQRNGEKVAVKPATRLSTRSTRAGVVMPLAAAAIAFFAAMSASASESSVPPAPVSSLDELALPPVKAQPWVFREFPILGWWAPPGTARLEDFVAYREAGFNLHPSNIDSVITQTLELSRKAGLNNLVFCTYQEFGGEPGPADVDLTPWDEQVVGWITRDEPGTIPAIVDAVTSVNALMRRAPDHRALFNLLPPHAQKDPSTTEVLKAAVRNGLPILSYDYYVIHADGSTKEEAHFAALELFRRESLKYDRPFWAFALTVQHYGYRRPSESDLRWKQFTNLAYGAKGLWYFTYWGPTGWKSWDSRAIIDPGDGSPTELYGYVKAINDTVQKSGQVLLGLQNVDVFHTNPPAGQRGFPQDRFWIRQVEGQDVLVSFFEDKKGNPYAMVVNKLHGMGKSAAETSDTIRLGFAPQVAEVEAVSWLDGTPGPLALQEGRAELPVAGGTGVLLKPLMRREKDQEPVREPHTVEM